ncbi:SIR2 family protein [Bacillus cereus]|nr:SIR2 family protein [Bacillus cereus]
MIKEEKYNINLIKKLKKVLNQEDTILFVGSGISLWSGLPSWYNLIIELANYLEKEGYSNADVVREKANDDLLLAASIGLKNLNKIHFKQFLKSVCGTNVAKPHEIHNKIVSLGPTCYITTNYDQLLEDTLREKRKGTDWDIVTNRQLTELATLTQARYRDYVFKIHGDVNDIESVVLSKEHYRDLYGKKNSTLNTLEILLTTKPIVFLGFGLRDPDFLLVKDKIKNIYQTSVVEHYAIMPDVSEEEISYWHNEYGIRILSYQTTQNEDGTSNHSMLLEVLDKLKSGNKSYEDNTVQKIVSNDNEKYNLTDSQVLSLLRFIDGQKLHMGIDDAEVYPMSFSEDQYKLCDIDSIMKSSDNALILGEPGGGKTYCLKHYSINQMEKFKELIIRDLKRIKDVTLPIYIDLKGYTGNVYEMIESLLPVDINLNTLKENLNMIFLFDSFNEMPKEIFEDRLYEKDFLDFKEEFIESKIVISSRTEEGLGKINLSKYNLRDIDYDYIKKYLDKNLIDSNTVFDREIMHLLQKPLYFKLLNTGKIIIDNSSTPHTIYQSFFNYLNQEFKRNLNIEIDLSEILSSIGYYALIKAARKLGLM